MDLLSLALAGLNIGARGYNLHEQNRTNRAANQFGIQQHNAEISAAENAKAQYDDDLARRRRMLQESLAARGVGESTIARDEMNYLNAGAERDQQGLGNRVNLARKSRDLFKRGIRSKRHSNYLDFGVGLANALGGAYSSMNS